MSIQIKTFLLVSTYYTRPFSQSLYARFLHLIAYGDTIGTV